MTKEERKVIFASSLGTVFEWYDFYLYGSLAAIIAKQFFSGLDPTSAYIFALLAFAAGFLVRPFGAIFFGRLGDMIGRKYTFLVTIVMMGAATFIVGLLPNSDPKAMNKGMVLLILVYLVILVTMVYGPIAAMLVEMFPTWIRYTSMSLPYHIGNG